ncbi:MAG: cell division/cell wall cluster transcriptional repressor MraZ [Candidatus Handelsmanbacteria bacterium RIFCSPLOWO2_12_FULL_64_10]|uniref:Transcriptional regulator MraZ n=1 Tax=Handelsmanbacteria sp. (strain RIFCSPLOWO2_12_FULL_64_10) TaxID=1817868 RepID=A0A1F6CAJ4_HANXR|nr:MAG: cell division/cell wall cluster transcriptional repressor MraZ [Candidatus Handelsmanbacteria bacterium RIFCSPLOWO2_12_FULL_64_10]
MFLGEFEHAVDDRGRLAVPAKFRAGLADGMVVTRGIEHCLIVWPMEEWRVITDKLRQFPLMNADARRLLRLLLSGATDATPDRLGRILVPGFLRQYADLTDTAVLVGVLDTIEIWSRANWEAERSSAEAEGSQMAEHLFSLGVRP